MRLLTLIGSAAMPLLFTGAVQAASFFHKAPFDFLFGNHMDTHQENNLTVDGNTGAPESLLGKFYIIFTGDIDPASGLPIARHPRGLASDGSHDERCGITVSCVVGWEMRGLPGAAKFVSHSGVNGDDHPVWLVNRAEESPVAPVPGMVIPQPGYYSHFHWITTTSTDPRASSVSPACDKKNAGELETAAPTAVNEVCQGWFLQITARQKFAFEHGGEIIPIRNGADIRSHLNMVTNYKPWPDGTITTTRD
ncbi:MAG: hypothetical protein WBO37_14650 [Gammaproteobacteria bacterium]